MASLDEGEDGGNLKCRYTSTRISFDSIYLGIPSSNLTARSKDAFQVAAKSIVGSETSFPYSHGDQ